jgi:hypothetical protein
MFKKYTEMTAEEMMASLKADPNIASWVKVALDNIDSAPIRCNDIDDFEFLRIYLMKKQKTREAL